jgi:hypothetical protein
MSKYELIRYPFAINNILGLMTCEQEQLIGISCDSSLKDMSDADKSSQFWLLVKNGYPSLSDKAIKVLFPFVTTYQYKTGIFCCCHENDINHG